MKSKSLQSAPLKRPFRAITGRASFIPESGKHALSSPRIDRLFEELSSALEMYVCTSVCMMYAIAALLSIHTLEIDELM